MSDKGLSKVQRRVDTAEYFVEHVLTGVLGYKVALRENDYGTEYIRLNAAKMFARPETVRFINEARKKHEYTKEKAVKLLEELKKDCETSKDRTNRLGVIKELNRIHQLYGDEAGGIVINQLIVSPEERKKELTKELKLLDAIEVAPLAIAE